MVTRDWPAVERLFQAALWMIVRDGDGEATGDAIMESLSRTDPTVPLEMVLYSLGVLAGQRRIRLTEPYEPLPNGEWARAKWTALEEGIIK